MASPQEDADRRVIPRPPATTLQSRENQLIALAVEAAEKQIRAGTASSQVITHFLKLGTVREQLEREKLASENELAKAKVESMASEGRIEKLYADAVNAFRGYQGRESEFDE